MELIRPNNVLPELCRLKKRWGLFLSFATLDFDEVCKAAPYLRGIKNADTCVYEGSAYLFFESEAEMLLLYQQTVGDDGPTQQNPYPGPRKVYALTCDPDGRYRSENT